MELIRVHTEQVGPILHEVATIVVACKLVRRPRRIECIDENVRDLRKTLTTKNLLEVPQYTTGVPKGQDSSGASVFASDNRLFVRAAGLSAPVRN